MLTVLSTCNSEKQGVGPGTRLFDCTDEVPDGFPLALSPALSLSAFQCCTLSVEKIGERGDKTSFPLDSSCINISTRENILTLVFFILCRSFMTFPTSCLE